MINVFLNSLFLLSACSMNPETTLITLEVLSLFQNEEKSRNNKETGSLTKLASSKPCNHGNHSAVKNDQSVDTCTIMITKKKHPVKMNTSCLFYTISL